MTIDVQARRTGHTREVVITAETKPCCDTDCCGGTTEETTTTPEEAGAIRELVRAKYGALAASDEAGCGCGSACCGDEVSMVGEAYDDVEGYVAEADLRLGCGLPTKLAGIRPGDTVLDLGSGAGLDAFIARTLVGAGGEVLGVDMTPEMVARARKNAAKLGYENVRFVEGDIEALPLEDERVDVVISNCVLNLVPDKRRAFAEMFRVLRPGGHFTVSDIVVRGGLPGAVRRSAELYAGCVAGAVEEATYLDWLREAGFEEVRVLEEKVIPVPDEVILEYVDADELAAYRRRGGAIVSVTVYGRKP